MQPAHGKGFRFALLPRQLFAFYQVERRVDDVKRLPRLQLAQLDIVVRIKAGEEMRPAVFRLPRGGEKGANEPHPVGGVKGKLVHVDEVTHHDAEEQIGGREEEDDEELRLIRLALRRQTSGSPLPPMVASQEKEGSRR